MNRNYRLSFQTLWYLIGGVAAINLSLAAVSFLKDAAFASYFGTTQAADFIYSAYLLPEVIGYNLLTSMIGVAAVPTLTRLWTEGKYSQFSTTARRLALQSAAAMVLAGIMLALMRERVFRLFGYPFDELTYGQFQDLYLILLCTLVAFPLYAVGSAALQAAGRFYAAALGPVILNAVMLLSVIVSFRLSDDLYDAALTFSWSILAGSTLMALVVWIPLLSKLKGTLAGPIVRNGEGEVPSSGLREIFRNMLPLLLLNLCLQAMYTAERFIAAHMEQGAVTGLNYAYRLAQFPSWVFVAAVTTVMLPMMSSRSTDEASRPYQYATNHFFRILKATTAFIVLVSAFLYAAREPLIHILFGRGEFNEESSGITSAIFAGYSLSVIGQAVSAICLRYFLARGKICGSAAIYGLSAAITLIFDMLMAEPLGPAALGYGALCGWTANAALMIYMLSRDSNAGRE